MRSRQELQEASGYANRPRDFDDLIHILDPELRLITPTDPEGSSSEGQQTTPSGQYYQLTHDYLVHSLRDWLTRKQRETRRGRAELRLAERSASWNAKPENRHLPSALEWANIRLLTKKKDWTEPQRKMMKRAGRVHGSEGRWDWSHGWILAWIAVGAGIEDLWHTTGFGSGRVDSRRWHTQTFLPSSEQSGTTAAGLDPQLRACWYKVSDDSRNIFMPASPFSPSMPPRLITSSTAFSQPLQANFPCCVMP